MTIDCNDPPGGDTLPHVLLVSTSVIALSEKDPSPPIVLLTVSRLTIPTCRVMRVGRQKPPAVAAGGVFLLGGMGGSIAAALRLPQPDLQ
ncbi:hypothetical protein T03_322 [Trichinella britovi]|uniref:Uncharacterized protein n=1 Tax=Trichinella britovi TaxID=45882 RepID=A0A0V1CZR8_TRIBR|nr:hypothetical protein T03_322 [Trichinella britovi]